MLVSIRRSTLAGACAVMALTLAGTAQADHLLGYDFNSGSGPALDNGAAPAANGNLNGGAAYSTNTPSGSGFSVDFGNDNPYAHVASGADVPKLDGVTGLTVTTWLNLNEYTGGNARLASKQNSGTFGGFSFNMNATPNDGPVGADNFRLAMFVGNNNSSGAGDFALGYSDADASADGEWAFLAVTYDPTTSTDNLKFYMGSATMPLTQLGTSQSIDAIGVVDGGAAEFGLGYTFAAPTADTSANGLQDDVRVWGRVLDLASLEGVRASNIPEPGSALLLLGGAGLLVRRQR